MTEKPSAASTQSAPLVHHPFSLERPSSNKDVFLKTKPKKEEDSIQCICNYSDDDGNTIFCEECKTWQHIACYYLGREKEALEEEFRHSCADCEPRQLDTQKAAERMQARLGIQLVDGEPHDKKSKKPPSKTHKKKAKPTDLPLNGHIVGTDGSKHGSPHDHPPAKKAKTSHKSSQSISAQAPKRSPSHSAPKLSNHGHPLSPATTPPDLPIDIEFHHYAPNILSRHEDPVQIVDTNTTANLKTRNLMSLWSKPDSGQFQQDTKLEFKDVVQTKTPSPIQPPLLVETREISVPGGTCRRWSYLTIPSSIEKDIPLVELNGLIGLQKDYCEDVDNRYAELCAPLPFVFFPPYFPLYIDTRREGSKARYVRLSCSANARLDTYVSDDSDYHFWLVSDRPIAANETITLPWDFRLPEHLQGYMERLIGRNDDDVNGHPIPEIDHSGYRSLADWILTMLAEYGGCACDGGDSCAFVRFRSDFQEKLQPRPNPQKRKRAKSKPHTISPTSTGQATNSRAASEGRLNEAPEIDNNNLTEGSRSKPPSRDRTPVPAPARHGSFDTLGILTEPTNRDKRKVQIAETLFQKSAQEQQPGRKKKKTTADGTANTTSSKQRNRHSISHAPDKANGEDERHPVDAGTSGSKSGSPTSSVSHTAINSIGNAGLRHASVSSDSRRSPSTSRNYSSTAVQTELYDDKEQSPKPRSQRRVVSLAMRLMHQRRLDSSRAQQKPAGAMELDSPVTTKSSQSSPSSVHKRISLSSSTSADADIPMPDATPTTASIIETSPLLSNGIAPAVSPTIVRSPELRVQMPPVPAFTIPPSTTIVSTPLSAPPSANGSTLQSPFSTSNTTSSFAPPAVNGIAATPSPIKKKMSLSEYKNKANKAAASAKPSTEPSHPLKAASIIGDTLNITTNGDHEVKELEKSAVDSSMKETAAA